MRKVSSALLLTLLVPTFAAAQSAARAPNQTAPAATPTVAPAITPTSTAAIAIPPPPTVNDPMLAPMAAAPKSISTWEEALVFIRANSTDLRIQLAEVSRAEGQSRSALAAALPQVNAGATLAYRILPSSFGAVSNQQAFNSQGQFDKTSLNLSASLSQPILALAPWHQIGTAHRAEAAARLTMADTKRTIALNVAASLVGAITTERVAELNRIGLRTALERLALTLRRQQLGGAHGLDVVRAQQDVENARATLVTGDESLRQAREALGLALGMPMQVGVTQDLKLDGLEQSARRSCEPTNDVNARADLAALRKRIEIAHRNVDNVKLQFAPTISAQSQFQAAPLIDSTFATNWSIQGVLAWNIWDGGARYGALRQTRAVEAQAEANLEALRRTATIQVTQARRAVEVAEQTRKVAADARALSAELDRLTRASYQEGRGTSLELVVAAAALRQADVTLALREFEVVRARVLAILALSTCPW